MMLRIDRGPGGSIRITQPSADIRPTTQADRWLFQLDGTRAYHGRHLRPWHQAAYMHRLRVAERRATRRGLDILEAREAARRSALWWILRCTFPWVPSYSPRVQRAAESGGVARPDPVPAVLAAPRPLQERALAEVFGHVRPAAEPNWIDRLSAWLYRRELAELRGNSSSHHGHAVRRGGGNTDG